MFDCGLHGHKSCSESPFCFFDEEGGFDAPVHEVPSNVERTLERAGERVERCRCAEACEGADSRIEIPKVVPVPGCKACFHDISRVDAFVRAGQKKWELGWLVGRKSEEVPSTFAAAPWETV